MIKMITSKVVTRYIWTILPFLIFVFSLSSVLASQKESVPNTIEQGREIAQKVFDRNNGTDFVARVQMILVNSKGKEKIREFISYEKDYGALIKQFIRFVSPEDIAGTGFLSVEKAIGKTDQFLYLPALRRSRRIVSSQKFRKFVNSDFTYEDMERKRVDDYNHRVVGSEELGGYQCFIVVSSPKEGVKSQYASVKNWVAKDIYVPLCVEYYDKNGNMIKKYQVDDLKKTQGIWTEMVVEMKDLIKKHRTILKIVEIHYNVGIKDNVFTRQFLEKW